MAKATPREFGMQLSDVHIWPCEKKKSHLKWMRLVHSSPLGNIPTERCRTGWSTSWSTLHTTTHTAGSLPDIAHSQGILTSIHKAMLTPYEPQEQGFGLALANGSFPQQNWGAQAPSCMSAPMLTGRQPPSWASPNSRTGSDTCITHGLDKSWGTFWKRYPFSFGTLDRNFMSRPICKLPYNWWSWCKQAIPAKCCGPAVCSDCFSSWVGTVCLGLKEETPLPKERGLQTFQTTVKGGQKKDSFPLFSSDYLFFFSVQKKNVMGTITKMVHHTKCSFKFKVEKIFPYAAIFCKTIQVSLFTHINPQTPRHIHFTIERQKSY